MKSLPISIFILLLVVVQSEGISQEQISIQPTESGMRLEDNTVFISEECRRLLSDENYRDQIYPDSYEFETITELLAQNEVPLALWYMINLYEDSPVFTLQIVKDLIEVDINANDYVEAFYTYAYADPRIAEFNQGTYHLLQPDLLDKRIKVVNTLAYFASKLGG